MDTIVSAYSQAHRRLFLLDYDGTLVDIAPTPAEAKPTTSLIKTLQSLANDPRNEVVIISGRGRKTLEAWFGKLPISLIAEHGLFIKPRQGVWRQTTNTNTDVWHPIIIRAMSRAVQQLPGSFIESKEIAVCWHYRLSDPKASTNVCKNLKRSLNKIVNQYGLEILSGSKVIEVMPAGIAKGSAALTWTTDKTFDFILTAGDDSTDESLFSLLPSISFSFKIGTAPTRAHHRLPSPSALIDILNNLSGL
jgi:trehalose 6-phosphate synthase/phosphatase